MAEQEYVRYCLMNHAVHFSGLCPSTCPVCGSRFDLRRRPVPVSELNQDAETSEAEIVARAPEAPAETDGNTPAQAVPAPISAEKAVNGTGPVRISLPGNMSLETPAPTASGRAPQPGAPVPFDPFGRQKEAPHSPAELSCEGGPQKGDEVRAEGPAHEELSLYYFSQRIPIPAEGGWLGREALGAEWFEGNRLVSRRHVFVKPDRAGRLIVQDDRSLNGVYYDNGQGRKKLEKGSAVLLLPGNVLWLYNVPLKVQVGMQ